MGHLVGTRYFCADRAIGSFLTVTMRKYLIGIKQQESAYKKQAFAQAVSRLLLAELSL